MTKTLRYFLFVIIGIILGSLVGFILLDLDSNEVINPLKFLSSRQFDNKLSGLELGANSPNFSLYSLEGDLVKLSDTAGKPVILNFWATWCTPCVIEMPIIQERYNNHKPELVVLAINAGESKKAVVKFVDEYNLTFTTLIDTTKNVQKLYMIRAYPTTYFIDKDGVIQAIYVGVLSENQLDKYLEKIGVNDG